MAKLNVEFVGFESYDNDLLASWINHIRWNVNVVLEGLNCNVKIKIPYIILDQLGIPINNYLLTSLSYLVGTKMPTNPLEISRSVEDTIKAWYANYCSNKFSDQFSAKVATGTWNMPLLGLPPTKESTNQTQPTTPVPPVVQVEPPRPEPNSFTFLDAEVTDQPQLTHDLDRFSYLEID